MKTTSGLTPILVAILLLTGVTAQAGVVFSDNFNVSTFNTDVDFEYNSGTRQSGSIGPLTYTEIEGIPGYPPEWFVWRACFYPNGNEDALTLIANSQAPWAMCSPDHNFYGTPELEIEFDVDPIAPWSEAPAGTGDAGFTFGGPGPGEYPSQTPTGMGLSLFGSGAFSIYGPRTGDSPDVVTTANLAQKTGYYHVKISMTPTGADSLVSVWVDGVSILSDYTKAGGFGANYMTFSAMSLDDTNNMFAFDNFSVTAVPEPGSMVALGSGLMGLLGLTIRRKR